MNAEAMDLWKRARNSLKTASVHVEDDPDSAASRAYYAAFYAVSALFSLDKKDFSKHSAIEAAVHRDLVKGGIWPKELGSDFSWLANIRDTGDYGGKGKGATMRWKGSIPLPGKQVVGKERQGI